MDIRNLKRDASKVCESMVKSGGQTIAKRQLRIMIPAHFEAKGLFTTGSETYFLGYYAILDDAGHYATDAAPTMIRTEPDQLARTVIDNTEYLVLVYQPGDVVIASDDVVRDETLILKIFNEILAKGSPPWWMGYEDKCKIFNKAQRFTGSNVGSNRFFYEILVATFARSAKDPSKQWRQDMQSKSDIIEHPPEWAPLRSVQYTASNTIAKISGSYFEDGAISALNTPTTRIERSERAVRL